MMRFSSLVKNVSRNFQKFTSLQSYIKKCSVGSIGRTCRKLGDHKILLKSLVSCTNYSTRNYFTNACHFQKRPPNFNSTLDQFSGKPLSGKVMILFGIGGISIFYYFTHLEEAPITKRKRFIVFDNKSVAKMSTKVNEQMLNSFEKHMLAPGHPKFKKVSDVVNSLLGANEDIVEIVKVPWKLTVVDQPTINAFVLVDGHIVVFTGMIDFCRNTDQLAAVLGHELSHVILEHIPEKLSNAQLLTIVLMIPLLIVFTVFPLAKAVLIESLMSNLAQVAVTLPFSRKLEVEADEVGMILAARACFDVREASKLWERMSKQSRGQPPGFLSTHPSHESRKERLKQLAGPAMNLRKSFGCPPLN
ncbi:metalloendopeptidase OMA1, mitochondrial-like [Nilaparvata lugens]|uniref:metalloendopeptidase OMA1, mitochondrial-like n=1 Tax=Nilaparvata lugens TaxID=108931 RepID=UPI00193C8E6B|nr:metalloendopeptidase OMA1, mitochondrial-like [Nilaparvata lugens]